MTASFRLAVLIAATASATGALPLTAADAHAGIQGGLSRPYSEDPTTGSNGNPPGYIDFRGWAYNRQTKPVQDVRLKIRAETYAPSCNTDDCVVYRHYTTKTVIADKKRTDIQNRYHLATAKVGFAFRFTLPRGYYFTNQHGRACLYGRDHGDGDTWRKITCRAIYIG